MAGAGSPTSNKPKLIKRGKENEFEVHLEYLMGGYGGSSRKIILYFTYNTSFIYLLRALQDATQLCTIPPIDFLSSLPPQPSEPLPYYPGYPRSPDILGNKDQNKSTSKLASEDGKSTDTTDMEEPRSDPAVPDTIVRPRRRSVRGYTLEDGPWTCRRFSTSNSDKITHGENLEIQEELEYLDLVEALKEANNTDMGTKHSVSVMHVNPRHGLFRSFHSANVF
jgi:hypothetical protein